MKLHTSILPLAVESVILLSDMHRFPGPQNSAQVRATSAPQQQATRGAQNPRGGLLAGAAGTVSQTLGRGAALRQVSTKWKVRLGDSHSER